MPVHKLKKRSWWDGSITTVCGIVYPSGEYREHWFGGGATCPTCKKKRR